MEQSKEFHIPSSEELIEQAYQRGIKTGGGEYHQKWKTYHLTIPHSP